jgi:ribonuclease HII
MPDFSFELSATAHGYHAVTGIDEAGRGPWAGPVVAAAVILDPTALPPGLGAAIQDSKALTPTRRIRLFEALSELAIVGVGQAEVAEIDAVNILQASMRAMARAVEALPCRPDWALVDGNRMPFLPCPGQCVVKGDARSLSIAAASIVAKVTRDRIMAELAVAHPGYGWERNMGYGTHEHRAALERLGVTPHHRRSFAPILKILRADNGGLLDLDGGKTPNPLNPLNS